MYSNRLCKPQVCWHDLQAEPLVAVKALSAMPYKQSDLRGKMKPHNALLLPVLPAAWQTSCACKSTSLRSCQCEFPPDINAGFRV